MSSIATSPEMVLSVYSKIENQISKFRRMVNRPLTVTEKILAGHFTDLSERPPKENNSYVFLNPDRVALQDVTGQMTILQFMQAGLERSFVPTTIHCDHLIQARVEGISDIKAAIYENNEVYQFLESASQKYGFGFWKPGAGIIHQVVLENYAFPGGLMIGTDSHTPNAGGLGMLAIGVGGLDAAETMAGMPWELLYPKRIGVYLYGKLDGWAAPKDIILNVASQLTVSGGTNSVIEYFGPGAESISCTGKATITNMGAEIGATCSLFPYDHRMESYLKATGRGNISEIANERVLLITQDPEVEEEIEEDPHKYFDRLIRLDLSKLEPHIVGPHTPDLARPISSMRRDVETNGYHDAISVALVGSCTNSSYEDMSRAASVSGQAVSRGVKIRAPLLVTPGSEMVRATIERDGQMKSLKMIGATVLANACGPCIGQWSRPELKKGEKNTIVTSYNRNFPGRNDGRRETMNFIASPEIVVALALGGNLSFNPYLDELVGSDGTKFKLHPPEIAPEVPDSGFELAKEVFVAPSEAPQNIEVMIDKNSSRLQKLEPFGKWEQFDFENILILAKVKGKCTTDHISPAGPWLMFRGHLDKISDNMLLGGVNAYSGEVGTGKNSLNGNIESYPSIARKYKARHLKWAIIGEYNYGEGSSREHAAMTPRYLGCAVVIAKSFARIHETNLKKQGVLTLTFENSKDYDKIAEDTKLSIDVSALKPGEPIKCKLLQREVREEEIMLKHSYNMAQVEWFRAGSALNILRKKKKNGQC